MIKKLNKRDSTTKIRALEEICTYLNTQADESEIKKLLPGWVYNQISKFKISNYKKKKIIINNNEFKYNLNIKIKVC